MNENMHPVDKAIANLRASEVGKTPEFAMSEERKAEIWARLEAMTEPKNARQIEPVEVGFATFQHGKQFFLETPYQSGMPADWYSISLYRNSPAWRFQVAEAILGMENEPGTLPNYGRIYRMKFKPHGPRKG
jgi:hypothetical protein